MPGIRVDGGRRLRQDAQSNVPVLMLTARATLNDKAAGFAEGADDYLVKPFELRELDIRLQALIRRSRMGERLQQLKVGDLELDLGTLALRRSGRAVELPAMPLKILKLLMKRSPNVVSRREIRQTLGDSPPDSDALRVHMHILRTAIRPLELPRFCMHGRLSLQEPDASTA
jgi:DNA-binding response OmpR family regulator